MSLNISNLIWNKAKAIISENKTAVTHICQDREVFGILWLGQGPRFAVFRHDYRVVLIFVWILLPSAKCQARSWVFRLLFCFSVISLVTNAHVNKS